MKKLCGPLVALLLFPVLHAAPRPEQPLENVPRPSGGSIQHQTQESLESALYFPDYVDGGGWSVQLALSNVEADAGAAVIVTAYDQKGQTVPDLFDSETTLEIPSLGSRVLRSAGVGEMRRGWIEVRTDTVSVSGLLTYRHAATGTEAGVEPVELGNHFALFLEESSDIGTGLAIFNSDPSSRIEFRIRDQEGSDPFGVVLTRGNFHQLALTIPEWFGTEFPEDSRGLLFLRTEDGSPFAPLGLRFGKRNTSLSAVPVIEIVGEGASLSRPRVTMSVSPTSVERGQDATLTWSSTNAESAEITPEIGAVPTSGSQSVSPAGTTTYHITVRSADGQTASDTATVTVTEPDSADQACAVGSVVQPGGGCNPEDADGNTIGRFDVENDGRGCLRIGSVTSCSGRSLDLNGLTIDQYRITFAASKGTDGNWTISKLSIS